VNSDGGIVALVHRVVVISVCLVSTLLHDLGQSDEQIEWPNLHDLLRFIKNQTAYVSHHAIQ
jgi:hypothetical protein